MTSYMSMSGARMLMTSQDVLEHSSRLVDKHLQADGSYSDLSDLLKVTSHTQPSVSGLHDNDYPSLADSKIGLESVSEVSAVRKHPLPHDIIEQFGHMQCNCLMGLFPAIKRAYICIDSDIFVWKYENGRDVAYFDGLSETILSAGLISPKPGIFQPHIQYLLCLATPVEIVLLGVSFSQPYEGPKDADYEDEDMHLLPDPLFSLSTDGTYITTIAGTDNGRIFMAGKDGCLYELVYQAEDGWFSRKCRKINHSTSSLSFLVPSFLNFSFADDDSLSQVTIDESRHIIYTRSEKGTIQVYDLGEDSTGMSRVAAVSQQTTMQNAAHIAKTIDRSNFKTIVHIAAIPKSESINIHLVAITSTGVRLYFTTSPFHTRDKRPSMLSLVHVRLPPGFTASAATQRPSHIHMAHYNRGTLVVASSQTEESDLLWTIGGDTFPFHSQLMETFGTSPVDGRTWAMSEVTSEGTPYNVLEYPQNGKILEKSDPPLVVTQHVEPIRSYVLLSSHGSHLMDKYHPVNQLQQLLASNNGSDNEQVQAFFKLHGEDQACATCLILACHNGEAKQSVSERATRAFFLYGGEPKPSFSGSQISSPAVSNVGPTGYQTQQGLQSSAYPPNVTMYSQPGGQSFAFTPGHGIQPQHMSTPNPNYGDHYMYGQHPMTPYPMVSSSGTGPAPIADVTFSGKHNGICIYFSRIIRPLWDNKIVSDIPYQTPAGKSQFLASRCEGKELSWHLCQLDGLKDFMDVNSQFVSPIAVDSLGGYTNIQQSRLVGHYPDSQHDEQQRRKFQLEAQAQENASLQYVQQLVQRTNEVLGLWKIITDHQFHIVAAALSKDQLNQLKSMTFRNLVVNGKEMCCALITCLINCYLNDNATVDAISNRLREICPSLYSCEDATCSKANEILKAAKVVQNKQEKEKMLREALMLYKNVTSQLDLAMVCSQFAGVRYFEGIVDLCLAAAEKRDPQQLAMHFYNNGARGDDLEGRNAYIARSDAYKRITKTLENLMTISCKHPQAPSVPQMPGPPPAPDPNQMSNAEAEQYSEQVLQLGLKSTDELFHVELYSWLIKYQLTEKLLEIQSPFLEAYLKREAMFSPDDLNILDLLWKHYEKSKNYSAAAKIQAKLADRVCTDIPLRTRIEYLSRAIMCAKSSAMHSGSASEGEFLHELEEKMEVARLQLQVMETLQRWTSDLPRVKEALSRLNSELLDITTLFVDFANPFSLAECKLAIVHCASHYDQTLVESIWTDIIEKELTATAALPPQSRMNTLSNKIVALAQLYVSTERYFPIAYLVKYLEKRSCQQNFDIKWVFTILQKVGVKLATLQEVYDRLFKSKDPFWEASKKPLHLLHVVCQLLSSFTENPTRVPNYERRQLTTVCLDALAGYLVELQAMSSTDPAVTSLVANFKQLQAKLERLLS